MAFPVSPTEGQTFTENNTVWIYSAVTGQWNRSVINPLNETLYVFGSASATGAAGEIQYTDGSRLAASPNLVWDDVNDELEVGGDVVLDDGGTFTTTLQTVTPTQNRTISFPDATGTVGLVAGSSGQLVYNNAGANAGVPSSTVGATGDVTLALNGAASTPPLELTGTWFTGGGATATKPQLLIEPAGTTSNAWSPDGTGLGVNAASTFTGRLLDLQRNGTSRAVVTGAGNVGIGTTSPAARLEIFNGHIRLSDNYRIGTGGTGDTPDQTTIKFASDNLGLFTGNTERARIDSSGSLLVGTSSSLVAGYKLQIDGPGGVTSSANAGVEFGIRTPNATFNDSYLIFGTQSSNRAFIQCTGSAANTGNLVFTTYNAGAGSERMRITSDAYVRLASGTGGIQFNGDTAAANALDDYEEGTWTPLIEGGTTAGTGTYVYQNAYYRKIGKLVFIAAEVQISAHTGTGVLLVAGLPFTAGGVYHPIAVNASGLSLTAGYYLVPGELIGGSTKIQITESNTGTCSKGNVAMDTSFYMQIGGCYSVV